MKDPCPKCNKDRALVGKVHNCRPQQVKPSPAKKRKAKKTKNATR